MRSDGMQRISVIEVDGEIPYAREMFENDDQAQAYWNSLLDEESSVLNALPCQAVMVIREELFKGSWVETCRKLVDVRS